MSWRAY